MIPLIDNVACVACGKCAEVCPPQALTLIDNLIDLNKELCEECGFCVPECPVNAIEIHFPLSTDKSSL